MIRDLLQLMRPYYGLLGLILVLLSLSAALESVGISLFLPLLLVLGGARSEGGITGLGVFAAYAHVLDGYTLKQQVIMIVAGLFTAILTKNILGYAGRQLGTRLELWATRDFRIRMFQGYMGAPYEFFLARKHGRLVNDLFDESVFGGQAISTFVMLASSLLTAGALYVLLLFLSWKVTLIVTVTFAVLTAGLQWMSALARRVGFERQRIAREFVAFGSEILLGIRQVRVFSAEHVVLRKFREMAISLSLANLRLRGLSALPLPLGETVAAGILSICIVMLAELRQDALIPFMVTFIVVLARIIPAVGSANREFINLRANAPSFQTLRELTAAESAPGSVAGRKLPGHLCRSIQFDRVSFAYQGNLHALALDKVSLLFEKGTTIALVGPSGAGKSTVADLVVRLYEPTEGRILVDGVDLRELDLESWRRRIGFVSQDTFVFNTSIRENIAFGMPDATDEQVIEAARQADAHDFIRALPQGYATVVGDRGLKLSGGERQRIAIARAVLRNPPLLIFDEATSSLDNDSEQRVQQAINRLSKDRTVIMIAHRLSTIVGADKILVLDRGRVAEEGTHAALLERRGLYWKLYSREAVDSRASDSNDERLSAGEPVGIVADRTRAVTDVLTGEA